MIVEHKGINHVDSRGDIRDIIQSGSLISSTFVTTVKGATRGNHYHLLATVYVYIVYGTFFVRSRLKHVVAEQIVTTGDLVTFPPMDLHALTALEDSAFILMADGPRGGDLTVFELL